MRYNYDSVTYATLYDIAHSDRELGKLFVRNSANRKLLEKLRKEGYIKIERYNKKTFYGNYIQVRITESGIEYLKSC